MEWLFSWHRLEYREYCALGIGNYRHPAYTFHRHGFQVKTSARLLCLGGNGIAIGDLNIMEANAGGLRCRVRLVECIR